MVDTSCLFLPRHDPSASSSVCQSTTADMSETWESRAYAWGRVPAYILRHGGGYSIPLGIIGLPVGSLHVHGAVTAV